MADKRVDILLALRTTLAGNTEALAQLDRLKSSTGHAGDEWDKLGRKLERKFSLPDMGYDLLRGVGAGGGFALVEQASELISEWWHMAAEEAKAVSEYAAKIAGDLKPLHDLRFGNMLERLIPEQQLAAREKQLDDLTAKMAKAEAERSRYIGQVARARTGISDGTLLYHNAETDSYMSPKNLGKWAEGEAEKQFQLWKSTAEEAERVKKEIAAIKETSVDRDVAAFNAETDKAWKARAEAEAADLETRLAGAKKFGTDLAALKEITAEDEARAAEELKKFIAEAEKLSAQTALRAATAEVEKFDIALEKLDRNPALTDQEKQARRVQLLDDQTAAIGRVKKALEEFSAAHPDVEVAAMTGAISGLGKRAAENEGKRQPPPTLQQRDSAALRDFSDPSKHYQSAGAGALGGISAQLAELGTVGDRVAQTIKGTIGGAFDSISANLTSVILGTESWRQGLANIGTTIVNDVVGGIIQMAVKWIEQQILMAVFGKALAAASVAAIVPIAAATAAIWAAPATLATIATFGGAAMAAPGEIAAATAMTQFQSMFSMGFKDGGYTGDLDVDAIAGVVHGREYVVDAATTARLGPDFLDALRFAPDPMAALTSASSASASAMSPGPTTFAAAGASTKRERVVILTDSRAKARELMRDPDWNSVFVDSANRNKGSIAG